MTKQDDDVTELSTRAKDAGVDDDVTSLSRRTVAADAAAEAAVGNDGAGPARDGVDAEEDITRISSRARSASQDTADVTRLSRRSGADLAPAPAPRRATPALPPGAIGGAAAERGVFGQPAEEYAPREAPPVPAPGPAPAAAPVPIDTGAPEPEQAHRRREAARHKRLITAVVVVAVTAAAMTIAVFGIVALLSS